MLVARWSQSTCPTSARSSHWRRQRDPSCHPSCGSCPWCTASSSCPASWCSTATSAPTSSSCPASAAPSCASCTCPPASSATCPSTTGESLGPALPWFNRTGWLGVKHQLTYWGRLCPDITAPVDWAWNTSLLGPALPWYNRTSWLGMKHQLTGAGFALI